MTPTIYFLFLTLFINNTLGTKNSRQKNKNVFEFNCGPNRIVREPFTYKSDSGLNKQIFISKDPIGSGGFSLVFAAYVRDQFEQLPKGKCVAVKVAKRKESAAKNEMAIKLYKRSKCLFKQIAGAKRSRGGGASTSAHSLQCDFIVQIFDTGTVPIENAPIKFPPIAADQNENGSGEQLGTLGVTIMELAIETLHDRIYANPMDFNDAIGAQHLDEQIREIVRTLRALHKVAMHLDVKPLNFLYVKGGSDDRDLLKLTDLDGAELLPKGTTTSSCKKPDFLLGTSVYASPEYFQNCALMSPKSDIWSLGIMVYELLLIQPHIGLYSSKKAQGAAADQPKQQQQQLKKANQHNKFLRELANIYKGFAYDKKEKEFEYCTNDLDWLDGHIEHIELIIRLWNEQPPHIALLLTALLSYEHTVRPSADAVLDFMTPDDGQWCHLEMARSADDGSLMLFSGISATTLRELLRQRVDEADTTRNVWLLSLDLLPEKFDEERAYFQQMLANLNMAIEAMDGEDTNRRAKVGSRMCGQWSLGNETASTGGKK